MKFHPAALARVLALGVGLAAGCDATVSAPAAAPTEGELAARYAGARGDGIDHCCALAGYAGSNPDCAAAVQSSIEEEIAAGKAAGATYDPEAAAACIADLAALVQRCPTNKEVLAATRPGPCDRVFTGGTTPPGAPCVSRWECADAPEGRGACVTTWTASGTESRCGALIDASAGDPCGVESSLPVVMDCEGDLWCEEKLTPPACVERIALGQPCDGKHGDPCVAGATCDRLGTKTCVPAKKTGEACTAIEECEGYECEGGLCVPAAWLFDDVSCSH